jgi:hypothetical protein
VKARGVAQIMPPGLRSLKDHARLRPPDAPPWPRERLWCVTDLGLYRASLSDLANLKFEPVLEKLSVNAQGFD